MAEYIYANPTYTHQHLPSSIKDAAGQETTYTYNTAGQPLTVTRMRNGQNETTTYVYETNVTSVEFAKLKEIRGPGNVLLSSMTYDGPGRLINSTNVDGTTLAYRYDALDRPLRTTYPDATYEQTIYDRLDPIWQRDRAGRWTRTFFDQMQRIGAVQDPLGRWTSFEHCPCGVLEAIIDGNGNRTTFTYDLQSRVNSKIFPVPVGQPAQTIQYDYEPRSGRLAKLTDPLGQVTRYTYFADNALETVSYTNITGQSLTPPTQGVSYTYDAAYQRVKTMTDGTGTTTYDYYPVNGVLAPLGDSRLASVGGPLANDTIAYSYDELGRPSTRSINGGANQLTRSHDALGRLTAEVNPLTSFSYGYIGNTGRLDTVTTLQGYKADYDYHPNFAPAGTGNGDVRLASIKHFAGASVTAQHDYGYDVAGNIRSWTQNWSGRTEPQRYDLQYDAADELTGAGLTQTASSVLSQQLGYTYDAAGNRRSERQSQRQGNGTYTVNVTSDSHNSLNQITSRTGGSGPVAIEGTVNEPASVTVAGQAAQVWKKADGSFGWRANAQVSAGANSIPIVAKDSGGAETSKTAQLTSTGTAVPALNYDANGNLLSDGTRTYAWDAANRIVRITYPAGAGKTEFAYDGLSRRVRAKEYTGATLSSDIAFVWEGMSIAEERDATTNAVRVRYYLQGEQQISGTTINLLYQRDHLGSVRTLCTISGTPDSRYDYDLWGRRTKITNAFYDTTVGYTGHRYHSRSGLHLAPYRAFSADLGRWLIRDPLSAVLAHAGVIDPDAAESIEGPNLYSYVRNRPERFTDRLGFGSCKGVGAALEKLAPWIRSLLAKAAQGAGEDDLSTEISPVDITDPKDWLDIIPKCGYGVACIKLATAHKQCVVKYGAASECDSIDAARQAVCDAASKM